ncbi:oligosaccharide flippase family protein [Microvirga tunisiensis]|uniref:Oligosaccharide flippase family protein n=1 Tax=Pannonibacter tanglangensis TaxID=2750084 RepID=A0A7X5F0U0_9HYPH|nr:oligosaccharide flippase family protein [Pannonibacter sp. XCT-53]NBN77678.1 oligosaccharide flippase family protein [Pannonibacter sp. XCT-53]
MVLTQAAPFLKLGAATGGAALLAFVTQTVLARQLGPDDYGRFSAGLSLVTIMAPLACFGIGSFWLSVFGKEGWQAERWLGASLRYVRASALAVLALLAAWALAGPHDQATTVVILALMVFVLAQILMELVGVLYQLEEDYTAFALWQVLPHVFRLGLLGGLLALLPATAGLAAALLAFGLGSLAIVLLGALRLRARLGGRLALKGHGPRPSASCASGMAPASLGDVLGASLPFGLVGFAYLLYTQLNVVLVKYLGSDAGAAYYNIAFMVMNAFLLVPNMAFEKVLVPRIHRWYHQDRAQLVTVLKGATLLVLILSAAGIVLLTLAGDLVGRFFFGAEGQPLAAALMILMWSLPLRSLSLCFGSVLFVGAFIRLRLWFVLAAIAVDVALAVALIPGQGAVGAAIAMVAAESVMCILFFLGMLRALRHGERAT